MLRDFKQFVLRGNVVDLAVGVVIGVAFGAVISALVADLLTPLIAAIAGKHDFSALTFTVPPNVFVFVSDQLKLWPLVSEWFCSKLNVLFVPCIVE